VCGWLGRGAASHARRAGHRPPLVDGRVRLTCACGLKFIQALRAAISDQCPDPT